MIFVDTQQGSADLAPLLSSAGLTVQPCRLEWADVEFAGRGVKGESVMIGIEVKRLGELTGDFDRLAGHQIPKMNAHYAHRYLVFEGDWKQNRRGSLLRRTGRMSFAAYHGQPNASQLRKKLITLEMCGGIHVHHINASSGKGKWSPEMIRYLVDLYRWWTDDDFDQHKSHIVNYQPHGVIPLNKFQQAFAAWPHISTKRAKVIASKFHNAIARACNASVEEWAALEIPDDEGKVRRLGMKTAQSIVGFLNGK